MREEKKEASFTDGEPHEVKEWHLKADWNFRKNNFRCGFCGYFMKLGEMFRWVYTNDIPEAHGNPLCCEDCLKLRDTDGLRKRWVEINEEVRNLKKKYWWFFRNSND